MKKFNSKAITSLTISILSFVLPFIGIITAFIGFALSFISVKEIVDREEKGMGIAIAGRIISIIAICVQVLLIVGYVLFSNTPAISQSFKIIK
ncbi:DUF4190 domain-containing protein [Clostridium cylindrosporum]|uniref:DUF4190 domain-containing protein n=1 Tax=Clostridium cylindrosporum DSM 605 TaxID=1121307 RepID=A0A0J8DBV6_CLOCY|nr:hypothetical protein [Clostridium cylindrosporum]KMT21789.1 hypothetical protein CLCY_3c00560 [Clostridium cylindrosporum DSM 605]